MLTRISRWRLSMAGLLAIILMVGCGRSSMSADTALSAEQAKQVIQAHQDDDRFVILDVRTANEYRRGHIAGAVLLDYYDPNFKQALAKLDRSKTYLIYCRSGNRSGKTLGLIEELKWAKAYHLSGGILAWTAARFPLVQAP